MGLIKNAIDSIKGTLADQDKTAINCQDMGNHILMIKKTNPNGIIRDGSKIIVNPGQMAVLIDNGKVIDATAEEGVYDFRTASAPTFYSGRFGGVFREMWTRFTFGGASYQDQAVYFINAKEIIDNGFGTPSPVMYQSWQHGMANPRMGGQIIPMRVALRCAGNYTFQIEEPDVFLKKIGGNASMYQKDELCEQIRVEILSCFQSVLNSLSSETYKIPPMEVPAQDSLIRSLMDQKDFDLPIRNRGIKILGFNIIKVDLDEESKRKIDEYMLSGDTYSQQSKLNDAVVIAAGNDSGANVGFMNLNVAKQNITQPPVQPQPVYQQPVQPAAPVYQQPAQPVASAAASALLCTTCGASVQGKFCAQCGTPAPEPAPIAAPKALFCSQCGAKASGAFCSMCGSKL